MHKANTTAATKHSYKLELQLASYKNCKPHQHISFRQASQIQPFLKSATIRNNSMKQIIAALVLFTALMELVASVQNLDHKYPFSNYLDDGTFKLHWDFDMQQQKIDFAVNVSTSDWIGFGISPDGKMGQSDVVMGWVNSDGTVQFQVSIFNFM